MFNKISARELHCISQELWFITEIYIKQGNFPSVLVTLRIFIWIAPNTVFLQLASSTSLSNQRLGESLRELLHIFF